MPDLNDRQFKAQVRDELMKAASNEKKLNLALTKIATLNREVDIYKTVLTLVKDGIVDAYDGLDKAEEFLGNNDLYHSTKEAHLNGISLEMFDGLADMERPSNSESRPEDSFAENLRKGLEEINHF